MLELAIFNDAPKNDKKMSKFSPQGSHRVPGPTRHFLLFFLLKRKCSASLHISFSKEKTKENVFYW